MQELTCFHKEELLAALKEALPDFHIRDIRFALAAGPVARRLKREDASEP
jgi:hypothetical protein